MHKVYTWATIKLNSFLGNLYRWLALTWEHHIPYSYGHSQGLDPSNIIC